MVTRRCSQRQFLLTPSAYVADLFLYCLAVAAERTGVLVHALTVMSNHYHQIFTDPLGRAPEFYGFIHEFVARALNAHYGRWENFWSSEPTSCVRLEDGAAILEKMLYTLANPVEAGLVSDGKDWPGVRLYEPGTYTFKRPKGFFRSDGPLPEEVTLTITAPPLLATAKQDAMTVVVEALKAREAEICAKLRRAGRRFLGAARVWAQRFTDTPRTVEARRVLSPRIACRNKWRRIESLQRCKQWLADYRDAWRKWIAGVRDVVFPAGTYQMVRRHGVAVAPS
jgi:putative transposase